MQPRSKTCIYKFEYSYVTHIVFIIILTTLFNRWRILLDAVSHLSASPCMFGLGISNGNSHYFWKFE